MLTMVDGDRALVLDRLPCDPTELVGEGLGDMGDGVPVLLEGDGEKQGAEAKLDEPGRAFREAEAKHCSGSVMQPLTDPGKRNLLSTCPPWRWRLGSFR